VIRRIPLYIFTILAITGYLFFFITLEKDRTNLFLSGNRLHQIKPVFPPLLSRLASGEFKGVIASFMTLEASSAIGSYLSQPNFKMKDIPEQAWDIMFELFETSQILDPYFSDNYRLVQPFFTWHANRPKQAISYLKKGLNHRYWDWELAFFIGFDYFYFLDDSLEASRYFQEAYTRPGGQGNFTLATFSAKLMQKSGKTELAIAYLTNLLQGRNLGNLNTKAFEDRLTDLKGALILERAIEAFKNKYNKVPNNTDDLVRAGILTSIPKKSFDKMPYCIDKNGKVFFDNPNCRDQQLLPRQ
jgi:tetratricopeptide (TPR) repeat protein